MSNHVVIDIGNTRIKVGCFLDGHMQEVRSFFPKQNFHEELASFLTQKKADSILLSSVNSFYETQVRKILSDHHLPYHTIENTQLKLQLDVEEPDELGQDRIANAYGALTRFPLQDCIVVDIGTTITFDYIVKEGKYLGGAIYTGMEIASKGLAEYTDQLPFTAVSRPDSALGKTTNSQISSGIYYGHLGAIERVLFELKQTSASPSSVHVVATGGATQTDDENACVGKVEFIHDLKDLVDSIDPHLTLMGLQEILNEIISKQKEK